MEFARDQAMLDKDFQLFYGSGGDIGLTPLLYKPITGEDGYVMMLVSPRWKPRRCGCRVEPDDI